MEKGEAAGVRVCVLASCFENVSWLQWSGGMKVDGGMADGAIACVCLDEAEVMVTERVI